MRVLFWSELYRPYIGGAEIFAENLIAALRARGVEFLVVTSHHDRELADEDAHDGVTIRRLPFRAAVAGRDVKSFVRCMAAVKQIKREFAPDLIHVNAVGPSVLFHLKTLDASPAPYVVTMQQEVLAASEGAGSLLGQTVEGAAWTVGCSGAVLEQLRTLHPSISDRSSCIYNGVRAPELAPAPLPHAPATLLCLGRLVPAKGFDVALRAFAKLCRTDSQTKLIVAGDGSERDTLQSLSRELGVSERVDFRGWVEPDDVPQLLNEATCVVMPSRREGLPVVSVQAALMARPIIATAVGGLPEVVHDGANGLIVPVDDDKATAAAMKRIVSDAALAQRYGDAARRHALAALDWSRTETLYHTLYFKLSGNHHDQSF